MALVNREQGSAAILEQGSALAHTRRKHDCISFSASRSVVHPTLLQKHTIKPCVKAFPRIILDLVKEAFRLVGGVLRRRSCEE